jgi:hypothetical protein
VRRAGAQAADGRGRAGHGGAHRGALVHAVAGDGPGRRAPAQRDRGGGRAGDARRSGYAWGARGGVGGPTWPVEAHVVGVVGALAVPAVEVDLHARLGGAGGERDAQLRVAGGRRRPGGRAARHADVHVVSADPARERVGGVGLHRDGLGALRVVGAVGRAGQRPGAAVNRAGYHRAEPSAARPARESAGFEAGVREQVRGVRRGGHAEAGGRE